MYRLLIGWISVQLLPQKVCNLKIIAHFSIGETVYKINKYMKKVYCIAPYFFKHSKFLWISLMTCNMKIKLCETFTTLLGQWYMYMRWYLIHCWTFLWRSRATWLSIAISKQALQGLWVCFHKFLQPLLCPTQTGKMGSWWAPMDENERTLDKVN